MGGELILPDWPAPRNVRALVTTRAFGDLKSASSRAKLRASLPAEPCWLRQVHGVGVIDASRYAGPVEADASFTRRKHVVCAVLAADCMPVLLADERGEAVGAAHAGWRGLSAGVIDSTVAAMGLPAARLIAWLGPAIGPRAYEVGEEVRDAFLKADARAACAFAANRPGRWLLDLYAVARQRLAALGVTRVAGGAFCTASDAARFFSYRRDRSPERMAAAIWLAE
ncbi:MAG TPA: peptidoglycan editing factor PgeF [Burkholderiales bacterium]|nr:peptidoglycan editing factor PgeF [Burkholderiales bacterium]